MIELLSCPFCGGEAKRFTLQDENNFGGDVIACQSCDACSRVVFGEKEGLVESWNRRAAQPAAGEANADVRSAFEEAWSKAMCNDEGVPGPKPLRSLVDPEEYRGGGVKFAWRWFQRGAQAYAPPAAAHGDSASEQHRNNMADTIVSLRTEIAALRRNAAAHGDEAVHVPTALASRIVAALESSGLNADYRMAGEIRELIAMRAQAGEGGE